MNEEINQICEILTNKMKEKFPEAGYTTFITLWQDNTFKVECRSGIPLDVEGYHLLRMFYWYNGEIKYVEDTYPPRDKLRCFMNNLKILNSNIDKSVNFVENQLVGFLESRFVRKCDDYFICYLSSQTGCNKGCQFCHLTVTKQTQFTDSDSNDFYSQAMQVFRHYRQEKTKARYVHYNFMARGEVLDNKYFLTDADEILYNLGKLASNEHLGTKFNISTIFPLSFRDKSLVDMFKIIHPTIYYSLYSCDENFRKKWMPGALSVEESFEKLKEYQQYSKKKVKIHYPFIKGENDSLRDLSILIGFLDEYKLDIEFNLVRYNPATPEQGEESDEKIITRNINHLKDYLGTSNVKIIPRVGFDVAASCGMFVK